MSRADVVVIGGGHNGLVAAALLAQGGKSVAGAGAARHGGRRGRDRGVPSGVQGLVGRAHRRAAASRRSWRSWASRAPSSWIRSEPSLHRCSTRAASRSASGATPSAPRSSLAAFSPRDAERYPEFHRSPEPHLRHPRAGVARLTPPDVDASPHARAAAPGGPRPGRSGGSAARTARTPAALGADGGGRLRRRSGSRRRCCAAIVARAASPASRPAPGRRAPPPTCCSRPRGRAATGAQRTGARARRAGSAGRRPGGRSHAAPAPSIRTGAGVARILVRERRGHAASCSRAAKRSRPGRSFPAADPKRTFLRPARAGAPRPRRPAPDLAATARRAWPRR